MGGGGEGVGGRWKPGHGEPLAHADMMFSLPFFWHPTHLSGKSRMDHFFMRFTNADWRIIGTI